MEALLSIGLGNAVAATVLAALVAAIGRVYRRPAVLHALWLLVLLKLITPPLFSVKVNWPTTADAIPSPAELPAPKSELPSSPGSTETTPPEVVPEESTGESQPEEPPPAPEATISLATVLLACWLSGALTWWTVAGTRLLRFHRLLHEARRAPEGVQKQARRLAALLSLRRCPPIFLVTAPISPMLWALGFSPRLLLPADLWGRLSAEQQDTLLAHELAHLRRGDHWIRRLEFVVLGLYWWHPIVWWARRQLQEAEEECCDACVVALLPLAASAYASALLETVTFLSHTRAVALPGVSGAGQVPLLKRRLTMILTANNSRRSSRLGFWAVFGLGALLLPLTLGAAQTDPPSRGQTPPPEDRKREPSEEGRINRNMVLPLDQVHANSCMSCHTAFTTPHLEVPLPTGWRQAHDEFVRLKRQTDAKASPRKSSVRSEAEMRERAEQIEKLQDEIELQKVQVKVKQAQIEGVRAALDAAKRKYDLMSASGTSIPAGQIADAKSAVVLEQTQLRIKEAELQEPLVRLKQAERRLQKLAAQSGLSPKELSARPGPEQRLEELEKKLNQILEEMKTLQKDMRRGKPGDSPGQQSPRGK